VRYIPTSSDAVTHVMRVTLYDTPIGEYSIEFKSIDGTGVVATRLGMPANAEKLLEESPEEYAKFAEATMKNPMLKIWFTNHQVDRVMLDSFDVRLK
jgi:hypothetical protein